MGTLERNPACKSKGKVWGRKEGEQPEERRVKQLRADRAGETLAGARRAAGRRRRLLASSRGELRAGELQKRLPKRTGAAAV